MTGDSQLQKILPFLILLGFVPFDAKRRKMFKKGWKQIFNNSYRHASTKNSNNLNARFKRDKSSTFIWPINIRQKLIYAYPVNFSLFTRGICIPRIRW